MSYPDELHDDAIDNQRIWDSRDEIRQLDEARLAFEAAARAFGEQIAKINPDFVELWERDTRARTATIESAVTSFVESVSCNIDDFLDHDYIQRTSEIAEMEEFQ